MTHDVFISYSTRDKPVADKVCAGLESRGIACWMAPRDIQPGVNWAGAILDAIKHSRTMVVVLTQNAVDSNQIEHEVERAHGLNIPLIALSLQQVALERSLALYLPASQWLDAGGGRLESHLDKLADAIRHIPGPDGQPRPEVPAARPGSAGGIPRRWRGPLIAALSLILIAGAAATVWLLWPAPHWTVESSRPFISTLALEGEPAFSPDGKMLAYTSGRETQPRQIYVRNVAGGDAVKLTNDAYDDVSPTWSSDGTRIAYVAQKPGEPCRIMVAAVPAGAVREAGRCSHAGATPLAWRPGTSSLYYIERFSLDSPAGKSDTIYRLDVDSGERQLVTSQYDATTLGSLLLCSPDGKWLFFLRDDSYESQGITILDLASGKQTVLGRVGWSASGAWAPAGTWSEDSRSVLVSASSGIGSKLIAYPIDGGAPYDVYTAATNIRHLATGGGLLALETDPSRENLARASATPISQPDIIDPASGMTWSPSFAPDGTLAFLSNRSGTNAIWLMKPGAPPAQFFDAGLAVVFSVVFSPDGGKLAAVFARPGGVTLRIFSLNGASLASFDYAMVGSGLPTWTSDGKALVMLDIEQHRDVRVEIADPSHRTPVGPRYWNPVTVRDDGVFSGRFDRPGFWQIDKGPRLISEKYSGRFGAPVAFRENDVLIPDFNVAAGPRILAQKLAGGPDRVLGYAPGARALDGITESQMAANPRTGEVIYVASVQGDTNIDLLTLAKR